MQRLWKKYLSRHLQFLWTAATIIRRYRFNFHKQSTISYYIYMFNLSEFPFSVSSFFLFLHLKWNLDLPLFQLSSRGTVLNRPVYMKPWVAGFNRFAPSHLHDRSDKQTGYPASYQFDRSVRFLKLWFSPSPSTISIFKPRQINSNF